MKTTYSHDLIADGAKAAKETRDLLEEIEILVQGIKAELEDEFRNYGDAINCVKKIRGTSERLKKSLNTLEAIDYEIEHLKTKALS